MLDKIKSNRVLPGLLFTLASAAVSFVLSWSLFSDQETLLRVGERLYDCGIDVLGAFVCAALYFGSMRQEGGAARELKVNANTAPIWPLFSTSNYPACR